MPELPEVETMVRGVRPHVEGQVISTVAACECQLKPISVSPTLTKIQKSVRGRTVTAVSRWAKRVILELDDGSAFAVEPRMTGLMLISDAPNQTHLRIRWDFEDADPLWFWDRRGLGTVSYYRPGRLEADLKSRLGVDALEMDAAQWQTALATTSRAVKVAMLDQKLVAGIGNLYASEILHRAKIDPRTVSNRIGLKRCKRIDEATHHVLNEAIRYEGSTLGDGTYRNVLNQDGSYQNSHRVYARADQPCPTCKTPIRRIVQTQRSTFFCPKCQKK